MIRRYEIKTLKCKITMPMHTHFILIIILFKREYIFNNYNI